MYMCFHMYHALFKVMARVSVFCCVLFKATFFKSKQLNQHLQNPASMEENNFALSNRCCYPLALIYFWGRQVVRNRISVIADLWYLSRRCLITGALGPRDQPISEFNEELRSSERSIMGDNLKWADEPFALLETPQYKTKQVLRHSVCQ
jgi:hypothetical protein